jgi:hypothetical protein
MTRIAGRLSYGSALNVLVLGCSKGAEVYSIAYAIRSARPDLKLQIHAVDTSEEILTFARAGRYSLAGVDEPASDTRTSVTERDHLALCTRRDQTGISIFDRMTEREIASMFDIAGGEPTSKRGSNGMSRGIAAMLPAPSWSIWWGLRTSWSPIVFCAIWNPVPQNDVCATLQDSSGLEGIFLRPAWISTSGQGWPGN